MPKLTRRVITIFYIDIKSDFSCQNSPLCRLFSPLVCFASWMRCRRTRSSFSSLTTTSLSRSQQRVMTETACHVPSTENTLHFPLDIGFFCLFWLLVTDPLSTKSFWASNFRFLIIWSIWTFHCSYQLLIVWCAHCFEQLLDHTMPSQCEVERNSVILTCTILPGSGQKAFHSLVIPILHRNLGHRHSAKSYWPSPRVLALFS